MTYLNWSDLLDVMPGLGDLFSDPSMPKFNLAKGQHKYLIVGEHGKKQYCYTPHRAKDGYFYTFEYQEYWVNPKTRTKKGWAEMQRNRECIRKTKLVHLTKSRSRKLAYKRACNRFNAALARSRKAKAA